MWKSRQDRTLISALSDNVERAFSERIIAHSAFLYITLLYIHINNTT